MPADCQRYIYLRLVAEQSRQLGTGSTCQSLEAKRAANRLTHFMPTWMQLLADIRRTAPSPGSGHLRSPSWRSGGQSARPAPRSPGCLQAAAAPHVSDAQQVEHIAMCGSTQILKQA